MAEVSTLQSRALNTTVNGNKESTMELVRSCGLMVALTRVSGAAAGKMDEESSAESMAPVMKVNGWMESITARVSCKLPMERSLPDNLEMANSLVDLNNLL